MPERFSHMKKLKIINFYEQLSDKQQKAIGQKKAAKSVYIQIKQSETLIEDYEKELEELSIDTTSLTLDDIKKRLNKIKQKMLEYVEADKIPIEVKKAFCDAFVSRVYVFDDDNGGGGGKKGTRVKIVFDAFETDGLGGFNDVEFNLSSISTSLGSPKENGILAVPFFFYLP